MDARIDPAKAFGLEEGDAHVIRNAGGLVTDDTGCGMLTFTNDDIRGKLREETGADAGELDFHPFPDLDESVRESVRRVEESPLLPGFRASGFVYDVETGTLREVA
jgi:carbonic anhydrase